MLAQRVVTLVGAGGVGKTRTSLQVAAKLADRWEDGVWLIELAPLDRADFLAAAVAQALTVPLAPDGDGANLVRALRSKHALLVFDNCEHLLQPAAALITAVLRGCPHITVLASSRQALAVDGEHAYRLPSLDVPLAVNAPLTANEALRSAAVELFAVRAGAADNRFAVTDDNAASIAQICRRLDGIPLAIELAAVRMRTLTPAQLSRRLDERFGVLTSGKRDALPRQQTLRALIDWSHDLLDDRERALFRRLAVFTNTFTLEAANAVGDDATGDVFDPLASLVDKSLIVAESTGDAVRYRLLESTRAYAREKLDAAAERDASCARHLRHMQRYFAEAYDRYVRTCRSAELNAQFATELDDVRAALAYARTADVRAGAALLADVDHSWVLLGLDSEGFRRCEEFLSVLGADSHALRARLCCIAAHLAGNNARFRQAVSLAVDAVAHARASGVPDLLASALRRFVTTAAKQQRLADAEAAQAEAETLAPIAPVQRLRLLESRAFLARQRGDWSAAADALSALGAAWAAVGHDHGEVIALIDLAEVEHARGSTRAAIALIGEGIVRLRRGGNRITLTHALCNLAAYSVALDDVRAGTAAAAEAIGEIAAIDAESPLMAVAIEHLALARLLAGDVELGARLAGYADARLCDHITERQSTERATCERLTRLLRERCAPGRLETLRAAGASMPVAAAIAAARSAASSPSPL